MYTGGIQSVYMRVRQLFMVGRNFVGKIRVSDVFWPLFARGKVFVQHTF